MLKGMPDNSFPDEKTFAKPVNYHLSDIADLNKDGHNDTSYIIRPLVPVNYFLSWIIADQCD